MFYFPLLMALFSTGFRYQKLFKVPHAAHLLLAQPTLQQMVKVDKHSTWTHTSTPCRPPRRPQRGADVITVCVWGPQHSAVRTMDHNAAELWWDRQGCVDI